MIRLTGGVMVVLCSWFLGIVWGNKQKEKLKQLELLYAYLDCIYCELEYTAAPLGQIASKLMKRPSFSNFNFSYDCCNTDEQQPFYQAFEAAAKNSRTQFGNEAYACLKVLACQLGTYSLEAQLSALAICKKGIDQIIEGQRPRVMQNIKLTRSLGVLGGLAVVILFW